MKKILSIVLLASFVWAGTSYAQKRITSYKVITNHDIDGDYRLSYDEQGRLARIEGVIERDTVMTTYTYEPGKITAKMIMLDESEEIPIVEMLLDDQDQITSVDLVGMNLRVSYQYDKKNHLCEKHITGVKESKEAKQTFIWSGKNISQTTNYTGDPEKIFYGKEKTPKGFNFCYPLLATEFHFSPHWPLYLTGYYGKTPQNLIASKEIFTYYKTEKEENPLLQFQYVMDSDGYPIEIEMRGPDDDLTILLFTYE